MEDIASLVCVCAYVCALPVTLLTLQDELVICIRPLAHWAAAQAVTWSTQAVVILPIRAQPRGGGATLHAPHAPGGETHNKTRPVSATGRERGRQQNRRKRGGVRGLLGDGQADAPLALPGSLRHSVKGWVQAVGVVADVAVVAQQQAAGVAGLAARLAHCALQTAPPLGEDDPCDLEQSSVERQWSRTLSHSLLERSTQSSGWLAQTESRKMNAKTKLCVCLCV